MKYALVLFALAFTHFLPVQAQQQQGSVDRIARLENEIESLKFRLTNLERLQGSPKNIQATTAPAINVTPQPQRPQSPTTPQVSTTPQVPATPEVPSIPEVPAPPPAPLIKQVTFTNGAGMKMIWLPGGSFRMGDLTGNGKSDEQPVRTVELSGYHLGATEVSQEQWKQVMGSKSLHFSGDDLPMERVNWEHALVFCKRLTEREQAAGRLTRGRVYHLPTEAQWEYACRAGTEEDFAGDLEEIAWYGGGIETGSTLAVATKKPNAWGFHDMHGNVWEWCRDRYQDSYKGIGSLDPIGPPSGEYRVLRGGSWFSRTGSSLRSSSRSRDHPARRNVFIGFRVAVVLDQGDLN